MLENRENHVGEPVEREPRVRGTGGKRSRAAVTGQLGDDHAPLRGERRRDQAPVGGGAAEAVDEDERPALPADDVADPCPLEIELSRLEADGLVLDQFGLRRHGGIFCLVMNDFGRAGSVMLAGSTIEGRDRPV